MKDLAKEIGMQRQTLTKFLEKAGVSLPRRSDSFPGLTREDLKGYDLKAMRQVFHGDYPNLKDWGYLLKAVTSKASGLDVTIFGIINKNQPQGSEGHIVQNSSIDMQILQDRISEAVMQGFPTEVIRISLSNKGPKLQIRTTPKNNQVVSVIKTGIFLEEYGRFLEQQLQKDKAYIKEATISN